MPPSQGSINGLKHMVTPEILYRQMSKAVQQVIAEQRHHACSSILMTAHWIRELDCIGIGNLVQCDQ